MFYRTIVLYFYLSITVIALISPSKIGLEEFAPGLFLMWFFFLFFYFGISKGVNKSDELRPQPINRFILVLITLIYPFFYNQFVSFYTSLSLISAVSNLFSGVSNYYIYQTFFNDSELNVFSISKLPYILGHGLLKFFYFYYIMKVVAYSSKRSTLELFCIALMTLVLVLVAVARGTSFEFFELFFMFLYVYMLKNSLQRKAYIISKKAAIKIVTIIVILIVYFMVNIKTRMGDSFNFAEIPDFNRNSILYILFPSFSLLIFSLNDYFLFGLQYTSVIFAKLFKSITGVLSILIPKGIAIFGIDTDYREFAQKHIDLAAKWNPDMSIYLDNYGLVITVLIVFILGFITKTLFKRRFKNVYSSMIVFYAMFFMISFPVGNFISNSSATIIVIILSSCLYIIKTVKI